MPKALRDFKGYSLYFWSNEGGENHLEPIHIHISKGKPTKNSTKVWITKDGIRLEHNESNIPSKVLKDILIHISLNRNIIISSWIKTFGHGELKDK